ncbi:hypothetical protein NP234_24715, partial [Salmonella enterica]|nr:hypothetical protein [Salmonella enterica]
MRIRALLLAAALITTTAASAQKSRDALLVKNEAASRSVIDQPSDDSSITIRDSAGDNLSADHSEIQGIGTASLKKRGYRGFADVGLIVGHVHYDCEQERGAWAGFAATTTHGFMFNRHIFLGAGFGIAHI